MVEHGRKGAAKGPVVVAIGASAGGVDALESLFDRLHDHTGAAFLVAMHLSPSHPSHLVEIIGRHTTMPVRATEDGMAISPDTVIVLPPGQGMTVEGQVVRLQRAPAGQRVARVIDLLFGSVAENYRERVITVVLSGTGSDGTLGSRAVKEHGGITVAQGSDGSAPMFAGMPDSAVAARTIDQQWPIEEMGAKLGDVIAALRNEKRPSRLSPEDETQRQRICAILQRQVGHDFSGYKPSTFMRRVHRRMRVVRIDQLSDYADHLDRSPAEAQALFRDLLISVTSFFRDQEAFGLLEQKVIPALFSDKGANQHVRVWVPGCATGEEAYSLAMLLLEYQQGLGRDGPSLRVFATDIDEAALAIARTGRYPAALLDSVSVERRERMFTAEQGHYAVCKQLREVCTFSVHNVLRDPPFSRIDLISCRNLLIYLGQDFQDHVMPIFHYALRPDGFLFVGVAEGASRHRDLFVPTSKRHRIYRRLPTPVGLRSDAQAETRVARPLSERSEPPALPLTGGGLRRQIETRILQAHAPAYVLVNVQGEALFYSARTGPYLEFAAGVPNRQLLLCARQELRMGLRHALQQAVETQQTVDLPETLVPRGDGLRRVRVSVEPFRGSDTPLYLVLFSDVGAALPMPAFEGPMKPAAGQQLQRDLAHTREQLQSTAAEFETAIEELRIANEDLMSTNEELQSSNEELETSKEELQSLNEELQNVNQELAQNVDALDQANADMRGLMESMRIPTIFLDRHLAIRNYTETATGIFHLIPSDRGRLLTDLSHRLTSCDLAADLQSVLTSGEALQRPVSCDNGTVHYLMSIQPCSGALEESTGLVITFTDVSALVQANERHQVMIGELNHRVRNMLSVVSAVATQTLARAVEPPVLSAFLGRLHAMARTYKLLIEAAWRYMALYDLFREEFAALANPGRCTLDGPAVRLSPRAAIALGMIVHELATNALKYGSLSNDEGQVDVTWSLAGDGSQVTIHWHEIGGPPVRPPEHRGFGSFVIERQLAYELGGKSSLEFAGDGLRVALTIPLGEASDRPGSA